MDLFCLKMKTGVFESLLYKIITKKDFLFRLVSLYLFYDSGSQKENQLLQLMHYTLFSS